ncbi:DUF4476 domain-containing protein [Sphingobacterium sp. 2149]|uniref:DUF4476 domain-containing protein n=1 Tax=Sphingobacterium sp. 2149 TaxID=2817763 RepID=UPI0028549ECE|nr:DUF4476 domain-containing protein [Sphingobacterium sp. 2149]MDR6737575.1 hypothetical protein [Sphingobacterium sp. 2149]
MYRKILSMFLLLIVAAAGFAQRYRPLGGTLNIYSTDVPFFLYINDILYNNRASRGVKVSHLKNRRYDLRIVFADRQHRTLNGSGIQLVDRNGQFMDVVFSVSNRRGNKGIILESMNPIDRYGNGNYRNDLLYDNHDRNKDEQYDEPYSQLESRGDSPAYNRNGYDHDRSNNQYRQPEESEIYRNGIDRPHGNAKDEGNGQLDKEVFLKTDSNRLNDLLNQKENDQDKLALAAQELQNMQLRVSEIADLMELFIRDDNKLTFAKYAYPTCVDKQNYEKVGDALSFSSTREKLLDFLKK